MRSISNELNISINNTKKFVNLNKKFKFENFDLKKK